MVIGVNAYRNMQSLARAIASERPFLPFVAADYLGSHHIMMDWAVGQAKRGGFIHGRETLPNAVIQNVDKIEALYWVTPLMLCAGEIDDYSEILSEVMPRVGRVVYSVGTADALEGVPEGEIVLVEPGLYFDQMGPWPLYEREVWITGRTITGEWRLFCELVMAGIDVGGILVSTAEWYKLAFHGWVVEGDLYSRVLRGKEQRKECATDSAGNIYDFWKRIAEQFDIQPQRDGGALELP